MQPKYIHQINIFSHTPTRPDKSCVFYFLWLNENSSNEFKGKWFVEGSQIHKKHHHDSWIIKYILFNENNQQKKEDYRQFIRVIVIKKSFDSNFKMSFKILV